MRVRHYELTQAGRTQFSKLRRHAQLIQRGIVAFCGADGGT
jgi:hypothetical protein